MPTPKALIVRAAGINCERELARAFEQAGAAVELVHLKRLIARPDLFDRFELIGFPGGFSYGDDISAGKIFATLMRRHLYPALKRCLERGVPMIAPCNGFQALVKMGLLPGPMPGEPWPDDAPPAQNVTLTNNAVGRFVDQWLDVEIQPDGPCIWTRGLADARPAVLPIAHGEGRFVTDPDTLAAIEANRLVALRYADASNINGSMNRIAGLCDASGLVLGLMPHPERFTVWQQHPAWTRLDRETLASEPMGLRLFRNAVEHAIGVVA